VKFIKFSIIGCSHQGKNGSMVGVPCSGHIVKIENFEYFISIFVVAYVRVLST
jgi:hypothetical protein